MGRSRNGAARRGTARGAGGRIQDRHRPHRAVENGFGVVGRHRRLRLDAAGLRFPLSDGITEFFFQFYRIERVLPVNARCLFYPYLPSF